MLSVTTIDDKEFAQLIDESMWRQSRPVYSGDARRFRESQKINENPNLLYKGLFQFKPDDAEECMMVEDGYGCRCSLTDFYVYVSYAPTEQERETIRKLPSPA